MVARSQPIAIKLKPDPPESDAERLRKLRKALNRSLAEAARANAEIIKIEAKMQESSLRDAA